MSGSAHETTHHLFWVARWYKDTELGRQFRDLTTVEIPDVVHRLLHKCFEYNDDGTWTIRPATQEEMAEVVAVLNKKRRPKFSG
jgi:hypothetical protein